jgi:hypothetical protein
MNKIGVAGENIANCSVCIREGNIIRHMSNKNDLSGNLVFVNNIIPYEQIKANYVIQQGKEVHYTDVAIVPKFQI